MCAFFKTLLNRLVFITPSDILGGMYRGFREKSEGTGACFVCWACLRGCFCCCVLLIGDRLITLYCPLLVMIRSWLRLRLLDLISVYRCVTRSFQR